MFFHSLVERYRPSTYQKPLRREDLETASPGRLGGLADGSFAIETKECRYAPDPSIDPHDGAPAGGCGRFGSSPAPLPRPARHRGLARAAAQGVFTAARG